jgi:catechol 2,3-dioxygenase-like lactoylglutathione lyase family enzyme
MGVDSWLYTQARVSNLSFSVDWYRQALGFCPVREIDLEGTPIEKELGVPGVRARIVQGLIGGVQLGLIAVDGAGDARGRLVPPGRLAGMTLAVDSVAHSYHVVQARGIACSDGPVEFPAYSSLIVYDPDGVAICLTDFRAPKVAPVAEGGVLGVRSWLYTQVRVSEMERSIQWYEEMFGFARASP